MDSLINGVNNILLSSNVTDVEEWKKIDEIPGYQISSFCRLLLLNGKISKTSVKPDGYIQYRLRCDNKKISKYAHVLVAKAFIPNSENKLEVDHINRNKSDNRVVNLRWLTKVENMANIVRPKSEAQFIRILQVNSDKNME